MRFRPFNFILKLFLAKELALASVVLKLVSRVCDRLPTDEIVRYVFHKLPSRWKAPEGPATESEFSEVVRTGLEFYRAVRSVLT